MPFNRVNGNIRSGKRPNDANELRYRMSYGKSYKKKETFEKSVWHDHFKFSGGFIDRLSGTSSNARGRGSGYTECHRC